jgi:hypothetical protein
MNRQKQALYNQESSKQFYRKIIIAATHNKPKPRYLLNQNNNTAPPKSTF